MKVEKIARLMFSVIKRSNEVVGGKMDDELKPMLGRGVIDDR